MDLFIIFGSAYTIYNIYDNISTKYYLQNNKHNKYLITEEDSDSIDKKYELLDSNKFNFYKLVNDEAYPFYVGYIFYVPLPSQINREEKIYIEGHTIENIDGKFINNLVDYNKNIYINNSHDLKLFQSETKINLRSIKIKLPIELKYTSSNKYYKITNGTNYFLGTNKNTLINKFAFHQRKPLALTVGFITALFLLN